MATENTAYQQKFKQDPAWYGGDGAMSVQVSLTRRVWIFADSFWAAAPDRVRSVQNPDGTWQLAPGCGFTGNSVGIQDNGGNVVFYGRGGPIFPAINGTDTFWPTAAFLRQGYLYVVGLDVLYNGELGNVQGTSCRCVSNPSADPTTWQQEAIGWPHGFAAAVSFDSSTLYAFGARKNAEGKNYPILARTPLSSFDDGAPNWTYRTGVNTWGFNPDAATLLWTDAPSGAGYAVRFDGQKWVCIHSAYAFLTGHVYMRTAPSPTGPWSGLTDILTPSCLAVPGTYVYSCQWHQGLGMYSVCNNQGNKNYTDSRSYFPSFFTLT